MEVMRTIHSEKLSTTKITLQGRDWEIATWKGGKTEVYQEYAEHPGLMQFLGYYEDVCRDAQIAEKIQPVIVSHIKAHRDHWRSYLPGAAVWMAA